MPFLASPLKPIATTEFVLVRSALADMKTQFVVFQKARQFIAQHKRVLVFDALLGLSSLCETHLASQAIENYFQGNCSLTDLRITHDGMDVITGLASQNLTALSPLHQRKIKQDLEQLGQNYDVVLIHHPYHVVQSYFKDMGKNAWVVSADKNVILNTLKVAQTSAPCLILDESISPVKLNQLTVFIKTLVPDAQLEICSEED